MLIDNLLRCAAVFAIATPLFAFADSLNMKTGTWEITMTTVTTGMPIPPEALDRMLPEQRAKVEEAMRARAGKARSHVTKSCVTQNDLDQNLLLKSADANRCKKKIISKSSRKIAFQQTCTPPRASTSNVKIEAKTPERIAASMDIVQEGASGKIHVDIRGRWLSTGCAAIKDGS